MLAGSLGDDVDDDDRQSMGFQMGNARLLNKPQNNYVWSWFLLRFVRSLNVSRFWAVFVTSQRMEMSRLKILVYMLNLVL